MIYLDNNKIIGLGGIKRAYLNNTLIFQSFAKVEEPKKYIRYDLNNQWEENTSLTVDGHIVLKSFSNYHVANSISRMRIYIYGYDSITFKIYSDGESSFDYTLIGNLDYDFSNVSSSVSNTTTGIKTTTIGKQKQWIDVAYTITESNVEHFIDVLYRKDSSADVGADSGYVALPMQVLGEKYEASTTEFISVESNGTYTFYEKKYKYVTYDNVNWVKTSEYIQGEVLSATLVENGTMCEGVNEYKRMEYTIDKYNIQTKIFTKGDLITENSENCQIVEIEWIANTTGSSVSDVQNLTFDTGVQITNRTKFQIKYKWMYSSGGMLVGDTNAGNDNDDYRFFNYMTNSTYGPGTLYFDINSKRKSTSSSSFAPIDKTFEIECGNHYIKNLVDGKIKTGKIDTDVFTRAGNIALWGGNANAGETTLSNTDGAIIYYLKVYDGDTLVRDYVPALNSNNQAGLYDKVTKEFYLPSGTGTLYHS